MPQKFSREGPPGDSVVRLSCGKDHTEEEIVRAYKSVIGSRQTPHAGPGRPKAPRCKRCGKVPSRCGCKSGPGKAQ